MGLAISELFLKADAAGTDFVIDTAKRYFY